MFPPMELDGGTEYYLKPMNCPMHILIYRSRTRSYRELPLRLFEFGAVYRYEKSGVIHGLTRVRGLTMDDAHIFTTKEQMGEELRSLLMFVLDLLRDYGLDDFYLELSTRPEAKAVGSDEDWAEATEVLRQAAESMDLELVMDEGGGAFYGPKISVQARDAIGRTWQMSTIQVDFQFPQRFDLHYAGPDGERHRPIMIHRALFGSVERFFGVLTEHYAGAFPLWLAPEQVRFVAVADRHVEHCEELAAKAKDAGSAGVRRRLEGIGRQEDPGGAADEGAVHAGDRRSRARVGLVHGSRSRRHRAPGRGVRRSRHRAARTRPTAGHSSRPTSGPPEVDHLWSPWRMEYIRSGSRGTWRHRRRVRLLRHPGSWSPSECSATGATAYVVLNKFPYNPGHLLVVPLAPRRRSRGAQSPRRRRSCRC